MIADYKHQTVMHVGRAVGARRHGLAVPFHWVRLGVCLSCMTLAAMADEPSAVPPQAAPSSQDDLTPARLIDDLESTGREKQERLNRIRLQLKKLAEAQRNTATDGPSTHPPESPLPPEPQIDTDILDPSEPPPDPHAVPAPPQEPAPQDPPTPDDVHVDPHADPAHDPAGEPLDPADGHPADPSAHATETLVGASIDRIALADSLFGNGQSDLALQAYDSIDLLKQPIADRYWIEYQLANCHRRLGDLAEAEQRYRRLAGLVDAGWCAVHARWWLDALSTRTALQRDLESIRTTLKTVEDQLNAQPQQ